MLDRDRTSGTPPGGNEILIFEPEGFGHHPHYVKEILRAIEREALGPVTLLTSPAALSQPLGQVITDGKLCKIELLELPAKKLLWRKATTMIGLDMDRWWSWEFKAMVSWFARNDGQNRFRAVFIPYLDWSHLAAFAFARQPFGPVPFGGIFLLPKHHLPGLGIPIRREPYVELRSRWIYGRILSNPLAQGLFTIDPYYSRSAGAERVVTIPDPAMIGPAGGGVVLRERLGIPRDAVILLAYGDMRSARKTLAEAIAVVADPRVPKSVVLVAAGQGDPEIPLPEGAIASLREQKRFFRLDHFIDDTLERSLFDAGDIVWVCYRNHAGSSGVLVSAGRYGKPVLACKQGLIGRLTTDHDLGLCAEVRHHDEIVKTLIRLAEDASLRARLGRSAQQHFSGHTVDAFTAPIVQWLARTRARTTADG